jgi:predicted nucleic acid-binding protein
MRRIYWDTMLLAYWFEDHKQYAKRVEHIYQTMLRRDDTLCSSIFILSELIVGPLKDRNLPATQLIERFFDSGAIVMLPYMRRAVGLFGELRAHHGVKAFDALHLSIAADAGVDLFLTHDRRLHKLAVPGLPFIASLDTDLF